MIIPKSLGMQQLKVDALQKILTPVNVPKLHTFLGLANYYRQFVKNFSLIAKPLTILTSKNQLWTWGYEQQQAFETLKKRLGVAPVLLRLNVSNFFELRIDSSSLDLGAVFIQMDDFDKKYVVFYTLQRNNTTKTILRGKNIGGGVGYCPFLAISL